MKGIIGKFVAVLGCASALAGSNGCYWYRDLVDPCYPERYWHASRQNAHEAFAPQVRNGHVLDQTVWNYHFEVGSSTLTAGGREHLAYLARRRPAADPVVYVQTAQDVAYDQKNATKFYQDRRDLDNSRVAAVKTFLTQATLGGAAVPFEVFVHNPPEVGISGERAGVSVRAMNASGGHGLPATGGASGSGGAGSSGSSGSSGGSGGSGR